MTLSHLPVPLATRPSIVDRALEMYLSYSRMMVESAFSVEAMIRGYHVYNNIWTAVVDEELICRREQFNSADPFAVAVVKEGTTVGHIPRKILSLCSLVLRKNGTIVCTVTGSRRYSGDLPQGGLKVPCTLKCSKDIDKVKKLLEAALSSTTPQAPPNKKIKLGSTENGKEPQRWVQHGGIFLSTEDKASIVNGELLNDEQVNFAQQLLKAQFPCLNGLRCTLLQSKKQSLEENKQVVQIIHSRGNHWIAVSSMNSSDRTVNVCNSLYNTLDGDTKDIIYSLFQSVQPHPIKLKVVPSQKQEGGRDCGLFSIASITALAFGLDPTTITFDQAAMRQHLVQCMEKHTLVPFPIK